MYLIKVALDHSEEKCAKIIQIFLSICKVITDAGSGTIIQDPTWPKKFRIRPDPNPQH